MFLNLSRVIVRGDMLLDLPRVVELGVRRGVHHLVARRGIRSLCSSGYVDCSRD